MKIATSTKITIPIHNQVPLLTSAIAGHGRAAEQFFPVRSCTIVTTLLTMSGGLLAGGVVFAEKFIALHRRSGLVWKLGMGGLHAFCVAGLAADAALINNYSNMLGLLHDHQRSVVDGVLKNDKAPSGRAALLSVWLATGQPGNWMSSVLTGDQRTAKRRDFSIQAFMKATKPFRRLPGERLSLRALKSERFA